MAELLSSKIVVVERPPVLRTIPGQPTAIASTPVVTEKGPVRTPSRTTSFEEWVGIYGGYIAASKSAAIIEKAFQNGLRDLWTSRVVHYTDITNPLTKTSAKAQVIIPDSTPANTLQVDGKYDGAYANGPTTTQVIVANASNGAAANYNLAVKYKGVVIEVFPNVVNTAGLPNSVDTVVNATGTGSKYIAVTRLLTTRPVNGTYNPTGGNDGLTGLADTDYTGSQAGGTGVYAFDATQGLRLMFAPDRLTSAVENAIIDYCEVTRNGSIFPVVDLPAGLTVNAAITHVETTALLLNKSEFGVVYHPHLKILNPSRSVFGDTDEIVVPSSGHLVGLFAQVDGARPGGVHDEPAGIERGILIGVTGLESDEVLDERKRDLLYPKRINPIHSDPGIPIYVDGARVLKGDSNFPTVAQRRGVIDIEQSIKDGLQSIRFRANDEETREEVSRTIFAFLLTKFNQKAFRGSTPETAFFVDVSEEINPPTEREAGRLNVKIGLATQRPIEFIVLTFQQDLRDLEAQLASAGA